ncbi:ABC transporter ATP-binding protein [Faecalicoccus pleomorphus]|uniref:ABC transporter ATP-binding protein n=1 Tax=Faecalicoccus pleomorphus TaxID=1323 RepID=A0AAW6CLY0_9FIRM|nr:ABC transporter ATP-binding protein [Faecalicoccus pleomorphus]MDB7979279.1 ABC transporter ATP-binding protein [Faecalicoccus pleomorphus]MDB7981589.1 ABC transporter ATP-binding protein [Faecalicoccus pleomorphus]
MRENKETLQRILTYLRPYRGWICLSFLLSTLVVGFTLYVPIMTGKAVDKIVKAGQVDFSGLMVILFGIFLSICVTSMAQWLMNHINNKITYRVVKDLRVQAFDHLQVLPLSFVDQHASGDLISRIITDIDQFSDGLLLGFTQLFSGVLTIAGTIVFMASLNLWITMIVVLLSPLSFLLAIFIAKKSYQMFTYQSQTRGQLTAFTNEMLGGIKVVHAFNYQNEAQKDFDQINEELSTYSLKATFYSSITNPATRLMYSSIYAGVAIAGSLACTASMISVGQLSSFLSYTNQYTKPFNEITGVITEFQNSIASAARVFALIDEPAEIPDKKEALNLTNPKGEVVLKHVDFSYSPNKPLIQDLNVSVRPGQRIAIVGPTGCGKTTLINLLMRFYDVQKGTIRFDGHDIREITRHSLRTSYGMVLQDTWLKAATVKENIAYGKPDATDEEIIEAAKKAYAHNFILQMPEGYDTILAEGGGNLSQGQKQLLCIARILLCSPSVLILDEATSSIDTMTELRVQKAFETLMKGRTSFIVAHRLSTIQNADRILVMNQGKIVEQGKHQDLLSQKGFYYQLYNSQFSSSVNG